MQHLKKPLAMQMMSLAYLFALYTSLTGALNSTEWTILVDNTLTVSSSVYLLPLMSVSVSHGTILQDSVSVTAEDVNSEQIVPSRTWSQLLDCLRPVNSSTVLISGVPLMRSFPSAANSFVLRVAAFNLTEQKSLRFVVTADMRAKAFPVSSDSEFGWIAYTFLVAILGCLVVIVLYVCASDLKTRK
jgi:hypothetical protein